MNRTSPRDSLTGEPTIAFSNVPCLYPALASQSSMTEKQGDFLNVRRSERYVVSDPSKLKATLTLCGEGEDQVLEGETMDVSNLGVKLRLSAALPPRQEAKLRLSSPTCGIEIERYVAVCWSRPSESHNWWIGLSLAEELPLEILDRLSVAGLVDRRRDRRLPLNVMVRARFELGSHAVPARLLDLSQGGFSIAIAEKPQEGDRLLLTLDEGNGTSSSIMARICWIREEDSRTVLGCSFVVSGAAAEVRQWLARNPDAIVHKSPRSTSSVTGGWLTVVATAILAASLWIGPHSAYVCNRSSDGLMSLVNVRRMDPTESPASTSPSLARSLAWSPTMRTNTPIEPQFSVPFTPPFACGPEQCYPLRLADLEGQRTTPSPPIPLAEPGDPLEMSAGDAADELLPVPDHPLVRAVDRLAASAKSAWRGGETEVP